MEIIKKNIHMYRQAKRAASQITMEEDFNVPDAKADVEKIIQSKAKVVTESTRAETGKYLLRGYVLVSVLYMDDTEDRGLNRLDMRLPFDEELNMDGLEAGDNVQLSGEIEDLNVVMINSRKLSMRGLLSFTAVLDEVYDMAAATGLKSDLELCEKKSELEYMQLEAQKRDIIRIREEIILSSNKPDVKEILWENIQLRGCELRLQSGKLTVEGELFVFVLYNGADETGTRQWLENTLPIKGEVEIPGASQDLIPDVEISLGQIQLQVQEDEDGEERIIHLEGTLDLVIRLYANRSMEILEDVFSPEKELEIFTREEMYESMVMRNNSRIRASGRIRIEGTRPRMLQICNTQGVVRVDDVQIEENSIRIDGAVVLQILYVSADDAMPFAVLEGSIPFSHTADVPGLDADCRYRMRTELEQLSMAMADSEEIEARAVISLNLLVVRAHTRSCIADIGQKELDMQKLQSLPGIVGYIVQNGDTLWDIARTYYTTLEKIMRMNQMEKSDIRKGDRLILMKEMGKRI